VLTHRRSPKTVINSWEPYEVNTLGYPKAALFGFCVAMVAYNVLSVVKGAMRVEAGEKKVVEEVSGYYLGLECASVYAGMMIALPEEEWLKYGKMSANELAKQLREWVRGVDWQRIKKSKPRAVTKTKTKRIQDEGPHLSTARLLAEKKKKAKLQNSSKTRENSP